MQMNVRQLKKILDSVSNEALVYVNTPGSVEDEGDEVLRVNICVANDNSTWDVTLVHDPNEV
jgi:hypothetical protein